MVSSYHPHNLRERVERVTAKTGQTLSEYQGFGQELICYTATSMFLITYWNSGLLLCSVCSIQSEVINFQHVLTTFVVFQSFT